jgi:hypothetical protein
MGMRIESGMGWVSGAYAGPPAKLSNSEDLCIATPDMYPSGFVYEVTEEERDRNA